MVLLFVANAGLTVSEFAGVGAAMELFGVSRYIAVPVALIAIWAVTVLGNYTRAERVFLVMGLVFLAYPIAAFLGHPGAGAGTEQPAVAALPALKGVPAALRRADRHDDHPLHAVLPDLRRRRQGRHADSRTGRADRRDQRGDLLRRHLDLHHHRHRRGDRRQRAAQLGRARRPARCAP